MLWGDAILFSYGDEAHWQFKGYHTYHIFPLYTPHITLMSRSPVKPFNALR